MAVYTEHVRTKLQREQKRKHYAPDKLSRQWTMTSVEISATKTHVTLVFPFDVAQQNISDTFQFIHNEFSGIELPSLLEITTRCLSSVGTDLALTLTRAQFALLSVLLLPFYFDPSSKKNLSRDVGYKSVALQPWLTRMYTRKTEIPSLDNWRLWSASRLLAGMVNKTVSGAAIMDHKSHMHQANSPYLSVYENVPRMFDVIMSFLNHDCSLFNELLDSSTVIYDMVGSLLMPKRIDIINYRLIDEVLNLCELSDMAEFLYKHASLVTQIRTLEEHVRYLDEHNRTFIKVVRDDTRWKIDLDKLHFDVFNAACDEELDPVVGMAMMCSLSLANRSNENMTKFLDELRTTCQYNKRVMDLRARLLLGQKTSDYEEITQKMMQDLATTDLYDEFIGLTADPPKYEPPRFPTKRIVGAYGTPKQKDYMALCRDNPTPMVFERIAPQPIHGMFLFFSALDRKFVRDPVKYRDTWTPIDNDLLLLPLSVKGHYFERAFFYI